MKKFYLFLLTLMVSVVSAFAQIEEGTYYIQNVESGLFLAGANSWGTQASVTTEGDLCAVALAEGGYTITGAELTSGNKTLGYNLYVDTNASQNGNLWTIAPVEGEDGVYTIYGKGKKDNTEDAFEGYVAQSATAGAVKGYVLEAVANVTDAAKWRFVTLEQRAADIKAGTDVSFLFGNPNFTRNHATSAWIVDEGCTNKNLGGGANENFCAESYHSKFNIHQTITGVPNGTYSMTVQGFYRNDFKDEETHEIPVFYVNGKETAIPVKTGEENSMANASASFTQGLYTIDPIEFEVTDGTITIGVKSDEAEYWCIWDNFQVTAIEVEEELDLQIVPEFIHGEEGITLNDHSNVSVEVANALKVSFGDNAAKIKYATYVINELVEEEFMGITDVVENEIASGTLALNGFGYVEFEDSLVFNYGSKYNMSVKAWDSEDIFDENFNVKTPIATFACEFNGAYDASKIDPQDEIEVVLLAGETEYALNTHSYVTIDQPVTAIKVTGLGEAQNVTYAIYDKRNTLAEGTLSINTIGYAEFEEAISLYEGIMYNVVLNADTTVLYDNYVIGAMVEPLLANGDFAEGVVGDVNIATYAKDGEVCQMQEVPGWTMGVENGDARAAGVVAYGSATTLGGSAYTVPAAGPEGTNGNALAVVGVWTGTVQYVQDVELPAGKYTMTVPVYNTAGTTAFVKNLIGVTVDTVATYATATLYPVGKWTEETVVFELAEDGIVTLSLGYEGANVGSAAAQHLFYDCVKIEAYDELAVAKAAAIAALPVANESVFTPNVEEVEAIKAAIEAATSAEEIEAAAAAAADLAIPALFGEYTVLNVTAQNYLGTDTTAVVLAADETKVTFEKAEGGFYIKVGDSYINMKGNDNWSMSATPEPTTVWNFNLNNGDYTIQGPKGMIGTDAVEAGSACYGDKNASKNGVWAIAEVYAPEIAVSLIAGEEQFLLNTHSLVSVESASAIKVQGLHQIMDSLSYVIYTQAGVVAEGPLSVNTIGYAEFEEPVSFLSGSVYTVYIKNGEEDIYTVQFNGATVEDEPEAPEITSVTVNPNNQVLAVSFKAEDANPTYSVSFHLENADGATVNTHVEGQYGENYGDMIYTFGEALQGGDYVLVLPAGSMTFSLNGDPFNGVIRIPFTVEGGADVNPTLAYILEGNLFSIYSEGKYLNFVNQDVAWTEEPSNYQFAIETPDSLEGEDYTDKYVLRIYENGKPRDFWGQQAHYLNFQPEGGSIIFGLWNNGQNGTDVKNGAVFTIEETENGLAFKNVARGLYLSANGMSENQAALLIPECDEIPATPALAMSNMSLTVAEGEELDEDGDFKVTFNYTATVNDESLTDGSNYVFANVYYTVYDTNGEVAQKNVTDFEIDATSRNLYVSGLEAGKEYNMVVDMIEIMKAPLDFSSMDYITPDYDAELPTVTFTVAGTPELACPVFSPVVPSDSINYYLYNVETHTFMAGGNDWGTRASAFIDNAKAVKLIAAGETYKIGDLDCDGGASTWIDGNGRQGDGKWVITELEGNTFELTNTAAPAGTKWGVILDCSDTRTYFKNEPVYGYTWALVNEADYEAYKAVLDKDAIAALHAAKAEEMAAWKQAQLDAANEIALAAQKALIDGTNVYEAEGYNAYVANYEAALAAFNEGGYTETVVNPSAATGWHSSTAYNFLLTPWTTGGQQANNFDKNLYINTWSTEGVSDGSNFLVPFFEYWTGDGDSLGENTLATTVSDLTPGAVYNVSVWARVRIKNGSEDEAYGISFNAGGEPVDICAGEQVGATQFRIIKAVATGTADEEGNLNIAFEIAGDNNISWLSYKDVKYTEAAPELADYVGKVVYIKNAETGEYLYGKDAQNTAMGSIDDTANGVVTSYALSEIDGGYAFRCVTPNTTDYSLWGSNPCYLNGQPSNTGVTFNLGKDQDIANGSTWAIEYNAEKGGWAIKNVGNGGYLNGTVTSEALESVWVLEVNEEATAISTIATSSKANGKYIENGKVVIVKNGVKYNVAGSIVK